MATITNINQLDMANGVYTYADYLLWKFEERVELLKGRVFKMSPAPSRKHQEVLGNLYVATRISFEKQRCNVYVAPFDVRLPLKNEKKGQIHTVVQPDLCVVCDPSKLDDKGCLGAPDLVVEILSPGNSKKELKNKFEIYEEAGVPEYWVIYPNEESIHVYVLENEKYKALKPIVDDYITSEKFPNLKIHSTSLFE